MTNSGYSKSKPESNTGDGDREVFSLDQRLMLDSIYLGRLELCDVLLFNDARYDWLILVPAVAGAVEFLDLSAAQQQQLAREVQQTAAVLKVHGRGNKLNVGALGNVVQQLHVHLLLRHDQDPAWPGPVWGHSPAVRYPDYEQAEIADRWLHRLPLQA
ncbi:HIT domain-containing protein [Pseudidiomarina sp.]|uniref:HIT domain-containing protein n=1 Tax=Pseudidiomarina sp. TaxID=2081707 RepID=UPI00299E2080|nr:HIT domain-containing protein [Pseudidiomarina sp.]MDX1705853.1 HIT domain-containing protein [Pseudidiomarina sp.]